MRYLITGAGGFIGGNLALKLSKDHEIHGYDNFSSSKRKDWPKGIKRVTSPLDYDYNGIFHLGMPSSSTMYTDDLRNVTRGIRSSLLVAEVAKDSNIPIVFASSSSLYNGNPTPFNEEMTIRVKDYYAEVRYWIERLFDLYFELYGVRSIGLRLFSVFGPRDENKGKYANNITQFALNLLNDERPEVYGDGTQTRDFTHVDHVVTAFDQSMRYLKDNPMSYIINVGSGVGTSFNDMLVLMNHFLKTGIKPKYVPNPLKNYVSVTQADTRRMNMTLGLDIPDFGKDLERHVHYLQHIQ